MSALYLLRHAKSSWADSTLADDERPPASLRREADRDDLERLGAKFPTAALATLVISWPGVGWRQRTGKLAGYAVPRQLR